MASLVPLPPVVVSRLAFPDYSSVVELVAAHDCDYPEESPRLWRARIKLPPWLPPKQSIGGRFPVLHGAEEHETSRVPETASKSVHPDYEASKRLWDRAGSSYPEMRYFLWQPQVKLPLLGDGSRCEQQRSHGMLPETVLVDRPCVTRMKGQVQSADAEHILDQPFSSVGLPQPLITEQEQARSGTWHRTVHPLRLAEGGHKLATVTLEREEPGRFSHDLAELVTDTAAARAKGRFVAKSKPHTGPKNVLSIVPIPVVILMREEGEEAEQEPEPPSEAVVIETPQIRLRSPQKEPSGGYERFGTQYAVGPATNQSGYW